MRKIGILLAFLTIFMGLSAQNVAENDTIDDRSKLVVIPDSLREASEEGDLYDLLNDEDLQPMDHPLTAADTLKAKEAADSVKNSGKTMPRYQMDIVMPQSALMDTLAILPDSLAMDSLATDSLRVLTDSISGGALPDSMSIEAQIDNLLMDPTVLDTLKFDSAYYYKQQQLIADSLRKDSIRLAKLEAKRKREMIPLSIREFQKMLATYSQEFETLFNQWYDYYRSYDHVKMRPEFYKYVVPLTYYSSSIYEAGNIDGWEPTNPYRYQEQLQRERMNQMVPDLRISLPIYKEVERQLLDVYVKYPELVEHNESELDNIKLLSDADRTAGPRNENFLNMIQPFSQVETVTESDLTVFRPNFWSKGGSGYLHFSQNHISDNWYKGGESTISLLSDLVLFANFNNKQGIEFENKLEWKLGFITAPSDTVHSYKVNNDLFRITSKFGLKAIKHWYYTLSFNFKTQFFSNYQTNSDKLISAFFSPAELNAGLGMDYKYVKDGVCNLSVLMTPFNYTLYTVLDDEVDPTKFNIEKDHNHAHVFGSRFEANMKWKIFKPVMWETRLTYTTNYEKVLAEWENTFTFVINKYLSTNLFIHARFDDGVNRKDDHGYFQLQEILSFGLNYTW